jgi:hypothetical protein
LGRRHFHTPSQQRIGNTVLALQADLASPT